MITINCLYDLTLFLTDKTEPTAPLTRHLLFLSDSAAPSCPRAASCAVLPPHPAELSTDQSAEEIHGLQHQFLVADPGHAKLLQVLMRDLQELLPADLLPLKVAHILLQAVIQTWTHGLDYARKERTVTSPIFQPLPVLPAGDVAARWKTHRTGVTREGQKDPHSMWSDSHNGKGMLH
ncbi:hypothetical protein EYF80_006663 [Liparis tanakae]|uniref:Uncharacterized protein n=1 Tax=Liparis tanakae TaxID=230148 RepID=A0A4Z2IYU5_9TELE|nr:hypothetical protein EYF80_006663 [Liparis tanakae]